MASQPMMDKVRVISVTLDPEEVSANTTEEQTFTIAGLRTGDFVAVSKPSHTTGVVVGSARVSAADTLAIQFVNPTGSGVNPASEDYTLLVYRAERTFGTAVM